MNRLLWNYIGISSTTALVDALKLEENELTSRSTSNYTYSVNGGAWHDAAELLSGLSPFESVVFSFLMTRPLPGNEDLSTMDGKLVYIILYAICTYVIIIIFFFRSLSDQTY